MHRLARICERAEPNLAAAPRCATAHSRACARHCIPLGPWLLSALCLLLAAPAPPASAAQEPREWVFALQPNHPPQRGSDQAYVRLYLATSSAAQGEVSIPGLGFQKPVSLPQAGLTTVELPLGVTELRDNATTARAVLINLDTEAAVYGINRVKHSSDAFLAFPTDALGTSYRVLAYRSQSGSSQIAIAAVTDDTLVTIHPTGAVRGVAAGAPVQVQLNRGDVYALVGARPSVDLTGTRIEASAPVAVMAGAYCAYVPPNAKACDHLTEMMPPLFAWGNRLLTLPLATRKKGDLIRVLADQDGTRVSLNGELVATLAGGAVFERTLTEPAVVSADKPILVGQYSLGTSVDGVTSDPFFVIVPPSEQFLDTYQFAAPDSGFGKNFVNVIAPTSALGSVRLDDKPVRADVFRNIGDSGFSGAALPIEPGSHRLTGNRSFGITVYGFDQADSYGYPGGMSFARINPPVDTHPPALAEIGRAAGRITLRATDSEDVNANGVLDAGEDLDADGRIGPRRTVRGGTVDRDEGLASVTLSPEADNLRLEAKRLRPGVGVYELSAVAIDPDRPGRGTVIATDQAGNTVTLALELLPTGFARLGDQPPAQFGSITRKAESTATIVPQLTDRGGTPSLRLSTDFDARGATLQIADGDRWITLDAAGTEIPLPEDAGPIRLRVRTGGCIDELSPGRFRLFWQTHDRDGEISRAEAPIEIKLKPTPWWICLLPWLIAMAIALALAFVIYGFIRPARFPRQLGVQIADEEDVDQGFFIWIRKQRGTGIGFYRDARAYVRSDFRVNGKAGSALAKLRADRGRVMIQPMQGNAIERLTADDVWEELPKDETTAWVGTLYRAEVRSLFFMLRNR